MRGYEVKTACRQDDGSGLALFFATFSSVAVITTPLPLRAGSAIRAGNTFSDPIPDVEPENVDEQEPGEEEPLETESVDINDLISPDTKL